MLTSVCGHSLMHHPPMQISCMLLCGRLDQCSPTAQQVGVGRASGTNKPDHLDTLTPSESPCSELSHYHHHSASLEASRKFFN